jgi:hypothetical protein
LASQTWSQEKCEAPVWKVGDKWTHKDATGATFTSEVVDIQQDVFVLKSQAFQSLLAFDKKTLNLKFLIGEGGQKMLPKMGRKLYNFPLFVGKKWTESFPWVSTRSEGSTIDIVCDYTIENIVEVNTPAGTFKTYVIYLKQGVRAYGKYGWARYWYSPEVKTWIKRELEKTNYWIESRMYDVELTSYELK